MKQLFLAIFALTLTSTAWCSESKDRKDVKAQATQVAATAIVKKSDKKTLDGVLADMTKAPQPVRHIIIAYAIQVEDIRKFLTEYSGTANVQYLSDDVLGNDYRITSLEGRDAERLRRYIESQAKFFMRPTEHPQGYYTTQAVIYSHLSKRMSPQDCKLVGCSAQLFDSMDCQKVLTLQRLLTELPFPALSAIHQRARREIRGREFDRLIPGTPDMSQDQRAALLFFRANFPTEWWIDDICTDLDHFLEKHEKQLLNLKTPALLIAVTTLGLTLVGQLPDITEGMVTLLAALWVYYALLR